MNATVVVTIPLSTLTGDTTPTPTTTTTTTATMAGRAHQPDQPAPPAAARDGQSAPPPPPAGCAYCRDAHGAHPHGGGGGGGGGANDAHDANGGGGYRPTGQAPGQLLGTDIRLSPAQARRMACRAGVIPAVLDGAGRVLDLGRKSRLATPAQILALRIQQHGRCAISGCDRPAHTCEAHHWRQPWAAGGRTDLAGLILLCPRHHTLADTPGMHTAPQPDGRFRLHRRE
jgi:hypothetical protein